MSRLLICSEPDLPSVNMRAALRRMHDWEDVGERDGARLSVCGDTYMLSIDDMHIRHDGLDRQAEDFGIKVDDVIVMSKHSAKSGKPAPSRTKILTASTPLEPPAETAPKRSVSIEVDEDEVV